MSSESIQCLGFRFLSTLHRSKLPPGKCTWHRLTWWEPLSRSFHHLKQIPWEGDTWMVIALQQSYIVLLPSFLCCSIPTTMGWSHFLSQYSVPSRYSFKSMMNANASFPKLVIITDISSSSHCWASQNQVSLLHLKCLTSTGMGKGVCPVFTTDAAAWSNWLSKYENSWITVV